MGKKAGKKPEEAEEVPHVSKPPPKFYTLEELTTFIEAHKGQKDSADELISMILHSALDSQLVDSILTQLLSLTQTDPTSFIWCKNCIELIFTHILDPKSRTKDAFYFPNAESEKKLISYLRKAKKTMIIAVFTLTNDDLATEIRHAKARGVDIRIISDDDLMKMQGSDIRAMYDEGIQVRVDLDPRAQMHHKFCVIDDYLLITGSFNWTKQAVNKNQENLVVLDDPGLCKLYTEEFDKMWKEFEPSIQRYFGGPVDVNNLAAPPPEQKVKKPSKKQKTEEGEVVVKEEVKTVSGEELIEGVKSAAGNMEALSQIRDLLVRSEFNKSDLDTVIQEVFEIVKQHPQNLNWGKNCIQVLFQNAFDPKTRIKDAFFFPSNDSEKKLIHYLSKAQKSMIVAVFTLTNDDLASEIRKARQRGVSIRIISDDDLMKMSGSDIIAMYEEGIEVRVDLDPRAQMHHKFCVIDDYLLITGSFNWTKQAVNKNQENLVVMDEPMLAQMYTEEFDKMWKEFEPSIQRYFGGLKHGG